MASVRTTDAGEKWIGDEKMDDGREKRQQKGCRERR